MKLARWLSLKRLAATAGLLLALAILLWLVGKTLWTALLIAFVAALAAFSYYVGWRDLAMLIGRGDPRPWLVRIREHAWRPVPTPWGRVPRPAAYVAILVGWWWLLC